MGGISYFGTMEMDPNKPIFVSAMHSMWRPTATDASHRTLTPCLCMALQP